jgi:hypothetical protein
MKRALSLVTIAALLCAAPRARAVEGRGDVESDHVDATDDGGPRTAGILVDPFLMAMGWLGAEFDAACGEHVVITAEGSGRFFGEVRGLRGRVGLAIFRQRFAFHGLYVHPTFEWERATAAGLTDRGVAGAVTIGYDWTWISGPTVRLGAGMGYGRGTLSDRLAVFTSAGFGPAFDANVGWVF